jgi:aarF domain-containing kinase
MREIHKLTKNRAIPIMREVAVQRGGEVLKGGVHLEEGVDLSLLKVWGGLEARRFLQASSEAVERCVKSDMLSPNV